MATTRKVAGIDLGPKSFLVVPDPDDASTWRLPIFVPGDEKLTMNFVKNARERFHETQGIPPGQRSALWNRLIGCCLVLGIPVQRDPVVSVTDDEISLLLAEKAANDLVGRMNIEWVKTDEDHSSRQNEIRNAIADSRKANGRRARHGSRQNAVLVSA